MLSVGVFCFEMALGAFVAGLLHAAASVANTSILSKRSTPSAVCALVLMFYVMVFYFSGQVGEVKAIVAATKSLPLEGMKLIFSGAVLTDTQTLEAIGVKETDFLVCVAKKQVCALAFVAPSRCECSFFRSTECQLLGQRPLSLCA